MQDWQNNAPFGYLRTDGRASILRAREFFYSLEDVAVEIKQRLGTQAPAHSELEKFIESTEQKTIGALLAISQIPELLSSVKPVALQRLLFRPTDIVIRGLTLVVVAVCSRDKTSKKFTHKLCVETLTAEFNINDRRIAERLATQWLHELRAQVNGETKNPECRNFAGADSLELSDLSSSDSEKAKAAFRKIPENETPIAGFVKICLNQLRESSDYSLHTLIIRKLIRHAKDSDRIEINNELAGVVLRTDQPVEVRDTAYQALHEYNQLPVNLWPEVRRAVGSFEFPADVDWDLIHSFRRYQ